jgi:hypothetical protein
VSRPELLRPLTGMTITRLTIPLTVVTLACGSTTLDPIEGAAGTSGSGGAGASSGSAGSSGIGGSSGSAGNAGSSGSGGSSGSSACTTPNPAGCVQTGCAAGQICDTNSNVCKSSSCTCDASSDSWVCDPDCGGGVCVPDSSSATHFVRFGYWQGQESTGEFCVAYSDGAGEPAWEPLGLLAQNGLVASELEGLDVLSRYVPLEKQPFAFGKAYTDCSGFVNHVYAPTGTHFTMLSVPYSFEADTLWVVTDPGPGQPQPGLRVVNAAAEAQPFDVIADGYSLGTIQFANSPATYQDISAQIGTDHLQKLQIENSVSGAKATLSWAGWDLVPLQSVTFYFSGHEFGSYSGLACFDAKPNFTATDKYSNCWFVPAQ